MNILVIRETNPFFSSNASNNRFLTLAEGLSVCGCDLKILITSGYYSQRERKRFGKVGLKNNIQYEYLLPVDFSVFLKRQLLYRFFPINYYVKKILGYLAKDSIDILWLDYGPKAILIGISIIKYKERYNFKVFHERSEFSWIGLNWIGYYSRKKIHSKYLKAFLPKVDAFALMTTKLVSYYKNFISADTKMIHLPMTVDFDRFETFEIASTLKKPYVAYCGTMNNSKDGVDILIESFIKIMNDNPDLHLYLAGPLLPLKDYLFQVSIIKKHDAEKRIIYLGNLSKEEIPNFLYNARVLALARPASLQSDGGFPTKLGEYLASGNPVCITNTGEIGIYLKHRESAFIAEPGSVLSFSQTLQEAINSNIADSVGEMGRSIAKKSFNKDIQSKELFIFLKTMLLSE